MHLSPTTPAVALASSPPWRGRAVWCAALAGALLCTSITGCVPTDSPTPRDEDLTPYRPDMSDMSAPTDMGDMSAPVDMGGDMTAPGDMGGDMAPADMGEDMTPGVCVPNRDGVIDRAEFPLRTGLYATFQVATDVTVDMAGTMEGGERVWTLEGPYQGDRREILEALDPTGYWFSDEFPGATYVARISATNDLLGAFQLGDEALSLQGIASPESGFTQTRLTYDPAVVTMPFPMKLGDSWTSDVDVSGTFNGVVSVYDETYTNTVDAKGKLKTPYGTFDVLRVRVELKRVVGFSTTRLRTFAFVSECFGTVATVVSEEGEDAVEFTTASEVRRLSP